MTQKIMLGVPCFAEPRDLLLRAIRSFISPHVHVVAIDNGAAPETKAALEALSGHIEIIRNAANIYVNPAWNQLARHFLASEYDVLVIANADLIAVSSWAESLQMRCAHAEASEQREYWVSRLATEEETSLPQPPSTAATRTDAVHGAFFAMTREAASIAFPVPAELLIHCGDDWIRCVLAEAGFVQQTLHGLAVWHKGFVSGSTLPEFDAIVQTDRVQWESRLRDLCVSLGKIEGRYASCASEPSDINEHIPVLSTYAKRCAHVTEFGAGRSTWGLLHGRPKALRSYDVRDLNMHPLREVAAIAGIDFQFRVGSSVAIDIEETDLLFIDTIHNYDQIKSELALHASKVRKYIVMHDTETFGARNESGEGPGLWPAVVEFLDAHHEWVVERRLHNNNGLTILAREGGRESRHAPYLHVLGLPIRKENAAATAYVATLPSEGLAQLEILQSLGCKPRHRVLEIGCGALVAGFPIMQYLDANNYWAIEPNNWLYENSYQISEVQEIISAKNPRFCSNENFRFEVAPGYEPPPKFDFIISHSILSHTSSTQLDAFLAAARAQLAEGGTLAASIRLAEGNRFGSPGSAKHGIEFTEWQYPGVSWFKEEDVLDRARRAGLVAKIKPQLTEKILVGNPKAIHDWLVARPMKVTLVTGFFRLRDRTVDEDAQFALFDRLASCGLPILLFLDQQLMDRAPKRPNVRVIPTTLEQLWTFRWADGRELDLPTHRTPEKDTRDFLLLQNAKLDMLELAHQLDGESTHFAWIDFGVMKISREPWHFLQKLQALKPPTKCVLAPGCWNAGLTYDNVNWRFCGGFLLVDRFSIVDLVTAYHTLVESEERNYITWEVNNWAELETNGQHFDWYKADHDDTLLPSDEPRICLVMNVKNESRIIERCLTHALPFIDTWAISIDDQSSDNTAELIVSFFDKHGLSGKIERISFQDFEHGRNESLRVAHSVPNWDYVLLLDADMVIKGTLDKRALTAPVYELVQRSGARDWTNARLMRRDIPGRYVGVTHEFLSTPIASPELLHNLSIDDLDDGGSKSDKAERDIRLLLKGLEKDPHNGRYMFYLAQTYRETERPHRALPWYKKRIEVGGWDEEIFYAYYGMALCYRELGDEANFIRACFDAYNYRPCRGEPLNALATYYRERGKNDSAMLIAEALSKIKFSEQKLFMDRDVYDWGAKHEISIAGFHSQVPEHREAGYRACAELTIHSNHDIRNQARKNFTHYAKSARQLFGAETRPIGWSPPDPGWAPMNPSVHVHEGRRLVLVRTVNYIVSDGLYPTNDGSGIIRTRNHILEMDANWQVTKTAEARDITGIAKSNFPVEGFEDCRLWRTDSGAYSASTTIRDLHDNPNGHHEMAIIDFDDNWQVDDMTVVRDYEHDQVQKNWMPIVGRPGAFLYLCHPTIAIEVSNNGRTVEIARHRTAGDDSNPKPVSFVELRGGSQLIPLPYNGDWLCLTHEVTWRPERVYLHRFVRFDRTFKIVALSDPFYFERVGIEFCAGLAHDGTKLIASYGINDASANLAFLEPDRVLAALKPL